MISTSEVTGHQYDRHRRWVSIGITYDGLAKLLSLPNGWNISSVHDNDLDNTINIKVFTGNTKELPEGVQLPQVMHGQAGWTELIGTIGE